MSINKTFIYLICTPLYVALEENKVIIASEPGFFQDSIQGLEFYIVDGGQVIPAGKEEQSGGTVEWPTKLQTTNLVGPFWLMLADRYQEMQFLPQSTVPLLCSSLPTGIQMEKYDLVKIQKRFIWNGSPKVKRVKVSKTEKKLKKKFMIYLKALKDFNQNSNYGATLIMLSSIRFQMRRQQVVAQGIQTGCINVIGTVYIRGSKLLLLALYFFGSCFK